jgi:hypothetical protein
MQELLNIEQIFDTKFNEIKTKCFRELGQARSWYYWTTLMSDIPWRRFHDF